MGFPVRLILFSSIFPLLFFSALFLLSFISFGLYLLFFFSTICICCCLLALDLCHKQRPETLLIHSTSSVDTSTEVVPPTSSSSSASSPPSGKLTYDVFLSFRGSDTRRNFTDHLYFALKQKGIFTFRDDEELERGESIGPSLLKAIEESRYVIVVFSQNYADSAWCLDEIVKVSDCMKAVGQKVLPVFYNVDPSEVRSQTGEHFGKAFQQHQEQFKGEPEKVKRWKDALFQVGNLAGWHLQDGYESKVIQEIVDKIFTELNQIISRSEGLVGMDSHLNEMLSCLDIDCPDVRIIWVCGMGGIGKTTIAEVVFERLQAQFESCSFLENVREVIEKEGAVHLQKQLLSNLLKCSVNVQNAKMGRNIMRERLRAKRVLIILDDVDQEEQLEELCARDRESFGPGSRIIITSRDEHLLREDEGDKVYKVNPLTDAEALQFFSMKAYKKDQLVGDERLKLSKEFLKYANGHPLAIRVLGLSVRGRSVRSWSGTLQRLKKNPEKKIIDVLKVSFDGLRETEKTTFLDIACFFIGEDIGCVTRILEGGGYCPDIDIEVLVEKSLVTMFGRKLGMHNLIQDLGREIVCQECPEDPGKRSRLWIPKEIIHVLDRSKATSAVESISLLCSTKDDVVHSINDSFSNMDGLRLLKIWNVNFSGKITYLSNELQYLEWRECPLDSFPSDFQPEKLVEVHLHFSLIRQLWRGKKGWSMLYYIDLSGSQNLMSTPDFTEVPHLAVLVLQDCTGLVEVHPSLGFLKKLGYLNMRNCKSIESLPPFTALESLQTLLLSLCSGLKKFPEIEGNMERLLELHLDGTSIEELPPSIEHLTGLTMLKLSDCGNLLHLPDTIGCLSSLKRLYLTDCSKIDELPENLNGIKCLERLSVSGTSIRELSIIAGMRNLRYLYCRGCKCLVSESCKVLASLSSLIELDLSYCNLMDGEILNDFTSLIFLTWLNLSGNCFVRLPESITQLSKLETLDLSNCRHLQLLPKKLPFSLQKVYAHDCTSLTDYPNQIKVLNSIESGVTIINSEASAPGVSQSSTSFTFPRNAAESIQLRVTHKRTEGEHVDHVPLASLKQVTHTLTNLSDFNIILAEDETPEWFSNISTRNPISIPIPQNLVDDNKWKGFAACAVFAVKGHTALSLIEPDPEFFNYSYKITLETDVVRLKPVMLKLDSGNFPGLGSSSHLLFIFSISRLSPQRGLNQSTVQRGLNQSTVVGATFETTNPSMVVQKCGIRLVYEQDAGWYPAKIEGGVPIWLNELEDAASIRESDWLSQSLKWEIFIAPLEDGSTLVLRKNLESVLPRCLEARNSSSMFKFDLQGSPGWFQLLIRDRRSYWANMLVEPPQNLHKNRKWMGFAIYASLVEEAGQTMEQHNYRVSVILKVGDKSSTVVERVFQQVRQSDEHHQLLVIYVPRAQIPEELFTQALSTAMEFDIKISYSPQRKVQRCGFRIVYQQDIQGFADTIIRCMQREGSLEYYDKRVVELWLQLLRLQGAHLERMTERDSRLQGTRLEKREEQDSRTPREIQFELHSQKYRNWEWSDPRRVYCIFQRVEISKLKWFMAFINQGNSAEIQLPQNVFDDDDWLGFALCYQLFHDQYPNNIPFPQDAIISRRLHSHVALDVIVDINMDWSLKIIQPSACDMTWFDYIPRTGCRGMWRQCKLARITIWSSNPCLAVHSCSLRLLFKKDVEHLVESLTIAELP